MISWFEVIFIEKGVEKKSDSSFCFIADPGLIAYAKQVFNSTDLTFDQWKQLEDQRKVRHAGLSSAIFALSCGTKSSIGPFQKNKKETCGIYFSPGVLR